MYHWDKERSTGHMCCGSTSDCGHCDNGGTFSVGSFEVVALRNRVSRHPTGAISTKGVSAGT